jgi:lipopolysaccharide/colanic/teichoic acid biosynthesis glycosyltransferase
MTTGGLDRAAAEGARAPSVDVLPDTSRYPRPKRALDLVLGTVGLVATLPVLVVVRLLMWLRGDRGPLLFRARRVGEGGRLITVLKIRTMTPGTGGPGLTTRDDPRITPLGRALRRTHLDELPQLWNVVRGEMALVGPRPEDPAYVDFADPLHRRVFSARPGMTGLAQLAFADEADHRAGPDADREYRETILPAKLKLDSDYLARRSARLDLAILGRTVGTVLGRRGADRSGADRSGAPGGA